jgi:RNase P subunit RPR2
MKYTLPGTVSITIRRNKNKNYVLKFKDKAGTEQTQHSPQTCRTVGELCNQPLSRQTKHGLRAQNLRMELVIVCSRQCDVENDNVRPAYKRITLWEEA